MKCNRLLQGFMLGEVLLLRLNVTVQIVKEFIRFWACELIMCGIAALETEGPGELPAVFGFGALFTKTVAVRLPLLYRNQLKIGYFWDQ